MLLRKKQSFPHGYGVHNVCSSTTPVFNFLTWKTFSSKATEKQPFSVCCEEHDPHPVTLSLPFTWPPLCTYSPLSNPLFSGLLYNMWLMWPFVLYVLTASPGLYFAVASERTAHKLHCLLLLLLAVTHGVSICWLLFFLHFSDVELLLYSWLVAAVPLQLCFCPDVHVSWDWKVYGKHIAKGTVLGQSDILPLLNKNFRLLQASGLHSYWSAFSFVVVTWHFMGPSFVFTETTWLYSYVFMDFHGSFCQMHLVFT